MTDKAWPKIQGMWSAIEMKKATRKELNREITELEKRFDILVKTGSDPGDDGQVPLLPPRPDV